MNYLEKIAKERLQQNLDHIILENANNTKTYWKIMSPRLTSSKPLQHSFILFGKKLTNQNHCFCKQL